MYANLKLLVVNEALQAFCYWGKVTVFKSVEVRPTLAIKIR